MPGETRVTDPTGRPTDIGGTEHLTDAELAGYVDHDITPEERRRVEVHIDQCAECRAEIVALSRIAHPEASGAGSGVARRRWWWLPAAAAAVIVAGVSLPRLTTTPLSPDTAQRSRRTDADGRSRFAAVAPASDTTVRDSPLAFTWHATDADAYRFILTTEGGDPVWRKDTGDTSLVLPDSVALQPGHAYFWQVEAIAKGITATTEVRRLQIAR
jgi:hypothetical protein